jgi:hypothetical protein
MILWMQIFPVTVMAKFRQCIPSAGFSTFLILLQMPYKSTERSDLKLIMFVMSGSSDPGSLNASIKLLKEVFCAVASIMVHSQQGCYIGSDCHIIASTV